MIKKIMPTKLLPDTSTCKPLDAPLTICIVGVFDVPYSSSVFFSNHLKDAKGVGKIIEFDYRDALKKQPQRIVELMVGLAKSCDLMIVFKGSNIPHQAITLASKHCKIFHWFMDWYPYFRGNKRLLEFSKLCHYRSATGYETSLLWSTNIHLPVYHVLDGAEPSLFYKTTDEKIYDVVFIGGADQERRTILKYLESFKYNVKFFGPGFTSFVGPEEFRDVCSKSKIVLNISRGKYKGYSSLRLWNCFACGSMIITKKIPEMETYMPLRIGEHIDEFSTLSDLKEKIDYYLLNENKREEIALNGMNNTLQNRTWSNVAKEIIRIVTNEESKYISDIGPRFFKKTIPTKDVKEEKIIDKKVQFSAISGSLKKKINPKK